MRMGTSVRTLLLLVLLPQHHTWLSNLSNVLYLLWHYLVMKVYSVIFLVVFDYVAIVRSQCGENMCMVVCRFRPKLTWTWCRKEEPCKQAMHQSWLKRSLVPSIAQFDWSRTFVNLVSIECMPSNSYEVWSSCVFAMCPKTTPASITTLLASNSRKWPTQYHYHLWLTGLKAAYYLNV